MSKKVMLFLFILSFIGGFFLRDMLLSISNNIDLEPIETKKEENIPIVTSEKELFEIEKLIVPLKAIRGATPEIIIYLKLLKRAYGSYKLGINLYDSNGTKVNIHSFRVAADKNWSEDSIITVGPVKVLIPENISLGKYKIELELIKKNDKTVNVIIPYSNKSVNTNIEAVSYN